MTTVKENQFQNGKSWPTMGFSWQSFTPLLELCLPNLDHFGTFTGADATVQSRKHFFKHAFYEPRKTIPTSTRPYRGRLWNNTYAPNHQARDAAQ